MIADGQLKSERSPKICALKEKQKYAQRALDQEMVKITKRYGDSAASEKSWFASSVADFSPVEPINKPTLSPVKPVDGDQPMLEINLEELTYLKNKNN